MNFSGPLDGRNLMAAIHLGYHKTALYLISSPVTKQAGLLIFFDLHLKDIKAPLFGKILRHHCFVVTARA
jgi:hypothetical protein